MDIYINSKLQQLNDTARITDVLTQLNITSQNGIAVAVNNNVIPKPDWDSYTLHPEDQITLIRATQGG
jgi:sulfur carrier protein